MDEVNEIKRLQEIIENLKNEIEVLNEKLNKPSNEKIKKKYYYPEKSKKYYEEQKQRTNGSPYLSF